MRKLIIGLVLFLGLAGVATGEVRACSDALYWCGSYDDLGECVSADPVASAVTCNAVGGACYPAGRDPCQPRGMCIADMIGCEGSTGSTCPSECRANSCGTGYEPAAGCGPITPENPNFGCKPNQACCRAISCDGSGGGGANPSDPRCYSGEVFVRRVPEEYICRSPGACEDGGDGIGGVSGDINWDEECRGGLANGCWVGDCVIPCTSTAPAAPSLSLPVAEANLSSTSVSLTWTHSGAWGTNCSGNTDQFQIILQTCAPSPAAITDPSVLLATVGKTTFSRAYTGVNGQTYCWKVRATNGVLTAQSAPRRFTIQNDQITGIVYNDTDATCGGSPSTFAGMQVSYDPDPPGDGNPPGSTVHYSNVSTSDGRFTISGAPSGYGTLSLLNYPAGYTCSPCSNGCIQGSIQNPSSTSRFYLTAARNAWWQVVGAGVYAGQSGSGVTVRSELPTSTTRLITAGSDSEGALIRNSTGSPNLGFGTQISDSQYEAVSRYRGRVMNYNFFASNMGVTSSTADSWGGASSLTEPPDMSGVDFYYSNQGGGEAVINSPWSITGADKIVVFVNGDLRINEDVTVVPGAFLAIIVSGDLIIGPNVSTVQGLYVMNGVFNTLADSDQLDVQGSIVTWSGVSLNRDLGDLNVSTPAERFTYRPDLLLNMTEAMKTFVLNWQEVAPGTFGD